MGEQGNNVIKKRGIIYKSVSGFYYVWSDGESFTTKPKGLFRHQKIKPLVGDQVEFEVDLNDTTSDNRIVDVLDRKNQLIRPSVVNVDYAWIVMSLIEPNFSDQLLDTFLVSVESKNIQPVIVLSKYDLLIEQEGAEAARIIADEILNKYTSIEYSVYLLDGTNDSYDNLSQSIEPGIYVVMGQSGVGKSTLLNHLLPEGKIQTAPISESLNRGKHTTREVSLYPLKKGLVADTPGFSSIELTDIPTETLQHYFPEISKASDQCKFRSCVHLNEPKCHVKELVEAGEIAQSRYDHYEQMYQAIADQKPIYNRKN